MHRIRILALLLVTLAMVTSVPAAGVAVGGDETRASGGVTAASDDLHAVGDSPAAQAQGQTNQSQDNQSGGEQARNRTDCNYVSLYEETIPSIVQIQLGQGLGSGFVYETSENATYVVTNEHVVGENESVGIRDSEGGLHNGTVVGASAFADLAVVRVNATSDALEPLDVANETPQPGQRVAALGSPYGLESTITSGIVSGVNRSMPTEAGRLPNTIQTDAPINPGNSGGPLVDCATGDVLGVNRAGGGENIGFAISAALVDRIVPELIETGEYAYPYLGVRALPLSQPIVEANDLSVTEGVYVAGVLGATPASDALQGADQSVQVDGATVPVGGDVIVAVDGQSVSTRDDLLSYLLTETAPEDTIELTIVRDGQEQTVEVTLGERPQMNGA
ncbi:peptidase S1 and S6 chymotrypsin/Hap [Halovivax asiaticus JCM 14624]|uniref:Peptidase S1 and S6 chymotrypsin/Hap n=1 Tax=Halovivax asiaticus JCM 14624 TaxID=1227490 RepID=M0BIQ7_9EURY|nr:trypsin-like peptidase domain-containing protein [Halovivax asiaticus]ELZ10781.1 peptidase S1 and S6 chymotrypsin/Hap [Halovivax asiaticus JCM 14624]